MASRKSSSHTAINLTMETYVKKLETRELVNFKHRRDRITFIETGDNLVKYQVTEPFCKGIESIADIANLLRKNCKCSRISEIQSISAQLCRMISDAYDSFKEANENCENYQKHLDCLLEKSVSKKSKLEKSQREEERNLEKLERKLRNIRAERDECKSEITKTKESIAADERSVRRAREDVKEKRTAQAVAAASATACTVFSFVTLGASAVGAGLAAASVASLGAVIIAIELEIEKDEKRIRSSKASLSHLNKKLDRQQSECDQLEDKEIPKCRKEIKECEDRLEEEEDKISELRRCGKHNGEISSEIKKVFTFISLSFGKTELLKKHASYGSLLVIVEIIRDIVEHLDQPKRKECQLLRYHLTVDLKDIRNGFKPFLDRGNRQDSISCEDFS